VSLLLGSRLLYGVAVPLAMVVALAGRRFWRHRDDTSPISRAVAVNAPRLGRQELRTLAVEGTDLRGYDLRRARLNGLELHGIQLSGADLTAVSFAKSKLVAGDFRNTVLDGADFSGSDLRDADLTGASLLETDFAGADLRGANLSGCRQMAMVNLRGAHFDGRTQWPSGLDPIGAGAVLRR
jgi:uncharacterized protein YjbI with pentapeptide repeats